MYWTALVIFWLSNVATTLVQPSQQEDIDTAGGSQSQVVQPAGSTMNHHIERRRAKGRRNSEDSKIIHMVLNPVDASSPHQHYLETKNGTVNNWKLMDLDFNYKNKRLYIIKNDHIDHVAMNKTGMFQIYARITLHSRVTKGTKFIIEVDGKPFKKCMITELDKDSQITSPHTCYTDVLVFLNEGQKVSIATLEDGIRFNIKENWSFWGIIWHG